MTDVPGWVETLIEDQGRMSQATWEELVARGLREDALVKLGFFFEAPGASEAELLRSFLSRETDFELDVTQERRGPLRRRVFGVAGTASLTKINLRVLDEWVSYMVRAGAASGRCRFDGWGTDLDEAAAATNSPNRPGRPHG